MINLYSERTYGTNRYNIYIANRLSISYNFTCNYNQTRTKFYKLTSNCFGISRINNRTYSVHQIIKLSSYTRGKCVKHEEINSNQKNYQNIQNVTNLGTKQILKNIYYIRAIFKKFNKIYILLF